MVHAAGRCGCGGGASTAAAPPAAGGGGMPIPYTARAHRCMRPCFRVHRLSFCRHACYTQTATMGRGKRRVHRVGDDGVSTAACTPCVAPVPTLAEPSSPCAEAAAMSACMHACADACVCTLAAPGSGSASGSSGWSAPPERRPGLPPRSTFFTATLQPPRTHACMHGQG